MLSRILKITGLTEADIWSCEYRFDCCWYIVRTYNGRRLVVKDEDLCR